MSGPASLLTGWSRSRPSLQKQRPPPSRGHTPEHWSFRLCSATSSVLSELPGRPAPAQVYRLLVVRWLWSDTESPGTALSVYERRAQAAGPVPSPPALRHQGSPPAATIKGQREPWPGRAFRMDWSDRGPANGSWIHVHSLPLSGCLLLNCSYVMLSATIVGKLDSDASVHWQMALSGLPH